MILWSVLEADGEVIWDLETLTTDPRAVEYYSDQSEVGRDASGEQQADDPFIEFLPFPDYVSQKGDAQGVIFRASITPQGVEDSPC